MNTHGLSWVDLFALFAHFLMLSLLAIGGAISTVPDMHRYVVSQQHWLTDAQFTASIALAQAAPGPNVLFVAVIGYNVAGLPGAAATLFGMLLPSTTVALWASRWGRERRENRGVRAFTAGLAPLTLGLLVASGWLLAEPAMDHWGTVGLVTLTTVVMATTGLSPLWLVGLGAALGMLGWA